MRSFVLIVVAACAQLLIDAPAAYADASPSPSRPCRAEDVGKPCPKAPFHDPERCVMRECDRDTSGDSHSQFKVVGEPKPPCYYCDYDEVADAPNRERRARERAIEIAEFEREDKLLAEQKARKKRNLRIGGALLTLFIAGYFVSRRFRSQKNLGS